MSGTRNASRYRRNPRTGSLQEGPVADEGREDGVDVLDRVVGVRGDAEVAVAVRGDDSVFLQLGDQSGSVAGRDADERTTLVRVARSDDGAAQFVHARDQALVQSGHVLARLGDADLL